MKYTIIILGLLFGINAMALSTPTEIPLNCKVGTDNSSVVLRSCRNKNSNGDNTYLCEGRINEVFNAKFIGNSGYSDGTIRITYTPANFTGTSPVQINDVTVSCVLSGR
jgi:hypothetical protein